MNVALPIDREKYKWLFQPLSRANRARLELVLGVVLAAASTVGLSAVIRPDPYRLFRKELATPKGADLDAEPWLAPAHVAETGAPPELVAAVASGDIAKADAIYKPKMPLRGLLGVAAENGQKAMITWLLENGADIKEDQAYVNAPILLADAYPDIVALLRERGAEEPSVANAALAGAPNAVDRLLAAKASLAESYPTPVVAALNGTRATPAVRQRIVDKLLAAGASAEGDLNESALAAATRTCQDPDLELGECLALVKTLVKHGAHTRGDALQGTFMLSEPTQSALLDLLLAGKLAPGAIATALGGWSPDTDITKRLLTKGVDWTWHDGEDDSASPLMAAIGRADREVVRMFLEAGAPVNHHYKDGTCALGEAITAAGSSGPTAARVVDELLAHGADVNLRLPDGRTPLFAAAEVGDLRVLTALLDHGARVNDVVLDETALDAAERTNNITLARVLHARGGRRAKPSRE